MLDMGCGWGLSSEAAAYLGLDVTAVDINEDFIRLVQARSDRLGLGIVAKQSSFDTFTSAVEYDCVLFYECLHHALRPWQVIERMTSLMKDGGRLLLCGEPINKHWWPNWGLRLDPLSVYCIRKHGWFESGWSLPFIVKCLERAQLSCDVIERPNDEIGTVIVATKLGGDRVVLAADWLSRNASITGAHLDNQFLVVGAEATITLQTVVGLSQPKLIAHNYRPTGVAVTICVGDAEPHDVVLANGVTKMPLAGLAPGVAISIRSETWVPAVEIGNADQRNIGFQISGLEIDQ